MDVRITTRHTEIGDAFRRHAEARASKLTRYEPRLLSLEVVLDGGAAPHATAEARADVAGTPLRIARGTGSSPRKALDQALDRLGRQLRRNRARRVDHQGPPTGALARP